jgi:hypothetical protein
MMFNLEWADTLAIEWVEANVDHAAARANGEIPCPPSSTETPHSGEIPPLGSWRSDIFGEYDVLIDIPVVAFQPSEQDWEWAIRHWSTQNYIRWFSQGLRPPPLDVVPLTNGCLRTSNRRRWLAAREAGVRSLWCWYSPTHREFFGRSRWWLPERGRYYEEKFAFALYELETNGIPLNSWLSHYELERLQRAAGRETT